jgi:hypothetical protein
LPRYPFSSQHPSPPPDLETHELGFDRYATHGGELGAGVTSRLAEAYAESLVGNHPLTVAMRAQHDPVSLTPDEQTYLDEIATWTAEEGGYQHQQSTRPLTLAHALADSPAGLLAWPDHP